MLLKRELSGIESIVPNIILDYPHTFFTNHNIFIRTGEVESRKCIAIKSIVVPPEYRDTGVAVLLFAEMAKRAAERGYKLADLSLTGESNADTWPLAHHMGAQVYKRYRFYRKEIL